MFQLIYVALMRASTRKGSPLHQRLRIVILTRRSYHLQLDANTTPIESPASLLELRPVVPLDFRVVSGDIAGVLPGNLFQF